MRKNIIIALSILGILTIWILSGQFGGDDESAKSSAMAEHKHMRVQVRKLQEVEVQEYVKLSGKTAPARRVSLKAEVEGKIVALGVERGAVVRKGDLIAEIDERDWRYKLKQAEALVSQRELEYEAAVDLNRQKLTSDARLAETLSALESARAQLEAVSIALENTKIRAPFAGKLQDRHVEVGDFVRTGDEVAHVVEAHPLIVEAAASERQVRKLRLGMTGLAVIANDEEVEGTVRYISPESDASTRTFTVEVEIPNVDYGLAIGETARLELEVDLVKGFKISSGQLALDDAGEIGVKVVNGEDIADFVPVTVIKTEADALYIAGPKDGDRLITIGHGFVRGGDKVIPVDEKEVK